MHAVHPPAGALPGNGAPRHQVQLSERGGLTAPCTPTATPTISYTGAATILHANGCVPSGNDVFFSCERYMLIDVYIYVTYVYMQRALFRIVGHVTRYRFISQELQRVYQQVLAVCSKACEARQQMHVYTSTYVYVHTHRSRLCT